MLLTATYQLNWSPLLLWSNGLKKSQEIPPGVMGPGEEGCQGLWAGCECFDQGGCVLVIWNPASPVHLLACPAGFSHL